MSKGKYVGLLAAVLIVGIVSVSFAFLTGQGGGGGGQTIEPKYVTESASFMSPPGATSEDLKDYLRASRKGDPLPPGYSDIESLGSVQIFPTTLTMSTMSGTQTLHVVVLTDESNDLDVARIYKNGNQVALADRQNGGIVDDGQGMATASMNIWVPDNPSSPLTFDLQWEDINQAVSSFSLSL